MRKRRPNGRRSFSQRGAIASPRSTIASWRGYTPLQRASGGVRRRSSDSRMRSQQLALRRCAPGGGTRAGLRPRAWALLHVFPHLPQARSPIILLCPHPAALNPPCTPTGPAGSAGRRRPRRGRRLRRHSGRRADTHRRQCPAGAPAQAARRCRSGCAERTRLPYPCWLAPLLLACCAAHAAPTDAPAQPSPAPTLRPACRLGCLTARRCPAAGDGF